MRLEWLTHFLKETYPKLKVEVGAALSDQSWDSLETLKKEWHDGYPPKVSVHKAFSGARAESIPVLWQQLADRQNGSAGWMLDIHQ